MKDEKETWKTYKKDIVIGVVTSLLSSAILWFTGWMFETAPRICATVPVTIENIIYTKAASVTEYTLFLLVLELITIVTMAIAAVAILMTATIKWRAGKDSERIFREAAANAELEKCKEELKTTEEKTKYIRKVRRRIITLEKDSKQMGRKMWLLLTTLILLIAFLLSIMVNFVQKPIKLKEQFDLELQIISPYVEEDVIAKLKSDWIMMYSKKQYLEIYEIIDAELEKQGISRYYWSSTETILSGAEAPALTK